MALTEYTVTVCEVIGAKFTSILSIAGSFLILRDIRRRYKLKKSLPMNSKIIVSMCLGDLGTSLFTHFLGTWMVPADQTLYDNIDTVPYLAAGTQGTCNAQGWLFWFFLMLGGWSNILLALCYYLMNVKEMTDSDLEQLKWKALFLGFPFLWGFCFSTSGVLMGPAIYNGGWFCEPSLFHHPAFMYFTLGIMLLGFTTILWCMVRLGWHTYRAEKGMDHFRQAVGGDADRTRTIQVSKQGLAYIVVFQVTFLPNVPYLLGVLPGNGYDIFYACVFPLQGLLNAIVHFRPRYATERRAGKSRMVALTTALNTADLSMTDLSLRMSSAISVLRTSVIRRSSQTSVASVSMQVGTQTNVTEV